MGRLRNTETSNTHRVHGRRKQCHTPSRSNSSVNSRTCVNNSNSNAPTAATNTPTATNQHSNSNQHATRNNSRRFKKSRRRRRTNREQERTRRSQSPSTALQVSHIQYQNKENRKIRKIEKHKFDPPARAIKIPFFPFLSYSHTDSVSPHFGMISQNPTIWSVLKIIKNLKTVLQKS